MPAPLFETPAPLTPLRAEIDAATVRVIVSGKFGLGPEVAFTCSASVEARALDLATR